MSDVDYQHLSLTLLRVSGPFLNLYIRTVKCRSDNLWVKLSSNGFLAAYTGVSGSSFEEGSTCFSQKSSHFNYSFHTSKHLISKSTFQASIFLITF